MAMAATGPSFVPGAVRADASAKGTAVGRPVPARVPRPVAGHQAVGCRVKGWPAPLTAATGQAPPTA